MGPRQAQRLSARGGRGAGGEHVIHEKDRERCRAAPRAEYSLHRGPALPGRAPGLRPARADPSYQRHGGAFQPCSDGLCKHPRLIEASLGQPSPGKRDPRYGVDVGGRSRRQHRGRQGFGYATPPRELESQDRRPGGSFEDEGGSRAGNGGCGTVPARDGGSPRCRTPAALTPWRKDGYQVPPACFAEGPGASAAARATGGKDTAQDRFDGFQTAQVSARYGHGQASF